MLCLHLKMLESSILCSFSGDFVTSRGHDLTFPMEKERLLNSAAGRGSIFLNTSRSRGNPVCSSL